MYRISVIEMQEMSRMDLTNSEEYRKYIVYVNKKENVLFEQNSADENKTNILLRCVTPEEFL